ncbi:hypothetical protein BRD00_00765 [Halobacteriales archaeon QS_8_69_26]|nr:MAG: hypothetical protein BRD00_00765 [Halobacteriales archaeon QS_8_69_26]
MSGDGTDEEFVLEPVRRVEVFRALLRGPRTRSELGETIDASRATLHRIVQFLEANDLARETDEGIELTSLGRVVAGAVTDYVDRATDARRLAPLLNVVDLSSVPFEFDLSLFEDATVTLPKPGQPQRPAQRVIDIIEEADRVRGFGPVVMPIYVEVFHREILDGMATELIVGPDVVAGLEQAYAEKFAEAAETGNLDMWIREDLPFGLFITPGVVGIVGYDEDDVLRVVVDAESDRLHEWAEDVYETYREDAQKV